MPTEIPEGYYAGVPGTYIEQMTCARCGTLVDLVTGYEIHETFHNRLEEADVY